MPPSRKPLLTEGPIARTLLLFSLPILGANVLQSLNASVNMVWIGHYLGEAALTASANANLVLFLLLGLVFGISMANTLLVGQSVGAKNIDQAKRVVGTSVGFFIVLSVLVAALGFVFTPQILAAMHTPADAQPFAIAYLRIIFLALPSMYFYSFLMMTLRGAGDFGSFDVSFSVPGAQGQAWIDARGQAFGPPDRAGYATIIGVALDVTEERMAQDRAQTAETRLRDAIDSVSEAFVLWDRHGRLLQPLRQDTLDGAIAAIAERQSPGTGRLQPLQREALPQPQEPTSSR